MNVFNFRPVGQGLFYTGSLMHGTFNFVYDCGTEDNKYIISQIDDYVSSRTNKTPNPVIDFVIISHLHKDHFSGLYHLVCKCDVKKIYLPYLGNFSNVIRATLALAIFGNESRAVQKEENDEYQLFIFMCTLYGIEENTDFVRYAPLVAYIRDNEYKAKEIDDNIYSTKNFTVGHQNNSYWQFIFMQKRVDECKLFDLEAALYHCLGGLSNKEFVELLTHNHRCLACIKFIYEQIFGEGNYLNLTSTILIHFPLYAEPQALIPRKNIMTEFTKWIHFKHPLDYLNYDYIFHNNLVMESSNAVTVLTGDAMIDAQMANNMRSVLNDKKILILQVPHHGSKKNWKAILSNKIDAEHYVIPFGYGNIHNHPSARTIESLIDNFKSFYCVTQSESLIYVID